MFSLTKNDTPLTGVTSIGVGAAWKTSAGHSKGIMRAIKRTIGTDLDLFAVAFSLGHPKGLCGFDDTDVFDDMSLFSHGDSRTGKASGDDEYITAHLTRMPPYIDAVVFIVAAYKEGVTFDKISAVTMNLYDISSGSTQISQARPDITGTGNAAVIATVTRGNPWQIREINAMGNARDRRSLIALASQYSS
jgi:stress response protein SCP2